jgi:hypothetical protein
MAEVVEEDGLSLHVFDAATGAEVLRFDCFDDAPHYHLLDVSRSRNVVVEHDSSRDGPLLDWALVQLRVALPHLLERAGAEALAGEVGRAGGGKALDDALDSVAQVSRYVLAAGRPVRVG